MEEMPLNETVSTTFKDILSMNNVPKYDLTKDQIKILDSTVKLFRGVLRVSRFSKPYGETFYNNTATLPNEDVLGKVKKRIEDIWEHQPPKGSSEFYSGLAVINNDVTEPSYVSVHRRIDLKYCKVIHSIFWSHENYESFKVLGRPIAEDVCSYLGGKYGELVVVYEKPDLAKEIEGSIPRPIYQALNDPDWKKREEQNRVFRL